MDVSHGSLRGDGGFSDPDASAVFGNRLLALLDSRVDDQYPQQTVLVSSRSQASELVGIGWNAGCLCDRFVGILLWDESLDLPCEFVGRQVSDGSVLGIAGVVFVFYRRLGWLDDDPIQSPGKCAVGALLQKLLDILVDLFGLLVRLI